MTHPTKLLRPDWPALQQMSTTWTLRAVAFLRTVKTLEAILDSVAGQGDEAIALTATLILSLTSAPPGVWEGFFRKRAFDRDDFIGQYLIVLCAERVAMGWGTASEYSAMNTATRSFETEILPHLHPAPYD